MASTKERVALVIGVSAYQDSMCPLPNAAKDALAVKELLVEQGQFARVLECINPTHVELLDALHEFKALVDSKGEGCVAVLFYAGERTASGASYLTLLRRRL